MRHDDSWSLSIDFNTAGGNFSPAPLEPEFPSESALPVDFISSNV